MKKYTILLIIASTLLGCKDVLELEPISDLTEENFFKTGADAESALVAAYDALQSEYYILDYYVHTEVVSDNCYAGGDNPNNFQLDEFTTTALNINVERDWAYLYEAISRANTILDNVESIESEDLSNDRKSEILAEASFLRAFHYFQLVNLWGEVPLILNKVNSTSPEVVQQEKASVNDIYAAIIADLEYARDNLPQDGASNPEKASRGAAYAMLAKVHAHKPNKEWDLVRDNAQEVMALGYRLLDDFDDLWNSTSENSDESIFEIQYIGGTNEANWGPQLWLPPSLTGDAWRKFNTPSKDLIAAYNSEGDNIRRNASILMEGNLPWRDPDFPSGMVPFPYKQREANGWSSSNNFVMLRLADIVLLYAEAQNELNNTPLAIIELDKIRDRVELPATGAVSKEDVREAIHNERRLELAFEGHRWFDLKRWNKAEFTMNQLNRNYNVTPNKLILPIPQSELDRNPRLTQNPGY